MLNLVINCFPIPSWIPCNYSENLKLNYIIFKHPKLQVIGIFSWNQLLNSSYFCSSGPFYNSQFSDLNCFEIFSRFPSRFFPKSFNFLLRRIFDFFRRSGGGSSNQKNSFLQSFMDMWTNQRRLSINGFQRYVENMSGVLE